MASAMRVRTEIEQGNKEGHNKPRNVLRKRNMKNMDGVSLVAFGRMPVSDSIFMLFCIIVLYFLLCYK